MVRSAKSTLTPQAVAIAALVRQGTGTVEAYQVIPTITRSRSHSRSPTTRASSTRRAIYVVRGGIIDATSTWTGACTGAGHHQRHAGRFGDAQRRAHGPGGVELAGPRAHGHRSPTPKPRRHPRPSRARPRRQRPAPSATPAPTPTPTAPPPPTAAPTAPPTPSPAPTAPPTPTPTAVASASAAASASPSRSPSPDASAHTGTITGTVTWTRPTSRPPTPASSWRSSRCRAARTRGRS